MDWIWNNCRFAIQATAGVNKELEDLGYYPSFIDQLMQLSNNNGNVAKNWTLPMVEELDIVRVEKFLDFFRRMKQYKGKRDIFQITAQDIIEFETDADAKNQAANAYSVVFESGAAKVFRATTPQAAAALSNCSEYGQNTWCTKNEGWSSRYMRSDGEDHDFFIITFNNKFAYAMILSAASPQLQDANGMPIYESSIQKYLTIPGYQDILNAIYFIIEKYAGGKWPDKQEFHAVAGVFLNQKIDAHQFDASFVNAVNSMSIGDMNSMDVFEKIKEVFPTLSGEEKAFVKNTIQQQNINQFERELAHYFTVVRIPMTMKQIVKEKGRRMVPFGPIEKLLQTAVDRLVQSGQVVLRPEGTYIWHAWAGGGTSYL